MFNNNSIKIIYFLIQISCMLLIMQCVVYIRFCVLSSHVTIYIKSIYIYTLYKHIKCIVLNAFIYWVAQKVPSVFKQNYETNFSFSPKTLLNNVFTILIYYLLPFLGQLHNSIFPKLFIFLRKKLFQVPFTVFQGIESFFH